MNLLGISINHRTAPIGLREEVYLTNSEITEFAPILKEKIFSSGFILSTCNRTEIYGIPKLSKLNYNAIQNELINFKKVSANFFTSLSFLVRFIVHPLCVFLLIYHL